MDTLDSARLYDYLDAIEFATRAHATQTRKFGSREPYVAHPIRASKTILKLTEDLSFEKRMLLATATVLHDVIEDTNVKNYAIADAFGSDVLYLVESVTKNTALPKADKELDYLLRFNKSGIDTVLIKLVDRLDNLKSMSTAPADFQRKYIANTNQLLKALPDIAKKERHVNAVLNMINNVVRDYE